MGARQPAGDLAYAALNTPLNIEPFTALVSISTSWEKRDMRKATPKPRKMTQQRLNGVCEVFRDHVDDGLDYKI